MITYKPNRKDRGALHVSPARFVLVDGSKAIIGKLQSSLTVQYKSDGLGVDFVFPLAVQDLEEPETKEGVGKP